MKSLAAYISKYLMSFSALVIVLLVANVACFIGTFHSTVRNDYGYTSPQNMLELVSEASTKDGTTEEIEALLHAHQIWAIYLNSDGQIAWSYDAPEELPMHYTIQDVALFSKGYLADYPVFVWNDADGLLVLGYPKDSYTKFTSNYFSTKAVRKMPAFFIAMALFDFALMFCAYFLSKRRIMKSTEPIIASIQTLSKGKPATLSTSGELSELAAHVNQASQIISHQNEARANWISGISHDIRTPLSMIVGYAARLQSDTSASSSVKEKATIIEKQSIKIKELVQDLNLVSKLEYEMQPLHKEKIRLAKLLRSYAAETLNAGIADGYSIELEISNAAEGTVFDCDARLIERAINNLVQNSMIHNPDGCHIKIVLDHTDHIILLTVADDGIGLSAEKQKELQEKQHYMNSTDERLSLRHGLGLVLVRQIVDAHHGRMEIESQPQQGYKTIICFKE